MKTTKYPNKILNNLILFLEKVNIFINQKKKSDLPSSYNKEIIDFVVIKNFLDDYLLKKLLLDAETEAIINSNIYNNSNHSPRQDSPDELNKSAFYLSSSSSSSMDDYEKRIRLNTDVFIEEDNIQLNYENVSFFKESSNENIVNDNDYFDYIVNLIKTILLTEACGFDDLFKKSQFETNLIVFLKRIKRSFNFQNKSFDFLKFLRILPKISIKSKFYVYLSNTKKFYYSLVTKDDTKFPNNSSFRSIQVLSSPSIDESQDNKQLSRDPNSTSSPPVNASSSSYHHISSHGCSRIFIIKVLEQVHKLIIAKNITSIISFPKDDMLSILKEVRSVLKNEQNLNTIQEKYGIPYFSYPNKSTYWTESSQFYTWWKNNIERKNKFTNIIKSSFYKGNDLKSIQRAQFCSDLVILVKDIKQVFNQSDSAYTELINNALTNDTSTTNFQNSDDDDQITTSSAASNSLLSQRNLSLSSPISPNAHRLKKNWYQILHNFINDKVFPNIIEWTPDGKKFKIFDITQFYFNILSKIYLYNTQNYLHFISVLIFYNFQIENLDQSSLLIYNPNFTKDSIKIEFFLNDYSLNSTLSSTSSTSSTSSSIPSVSTSVSPFFPYSSVSQNPNDKLLIDIIANSKNQNSNFFPFKTNNNITQPSLSPEHYYLSLLSDPSLRKRSFHESNLATSGSVSNSILKNLSINNSGISNANILDLLSNKNSNSNFSFRSNLNPTLQFPLNNNQLLSNISPQNLQFDLTNNANLYNTNPSALNILPSNLSGISAVNQGVHPSLSLFQNSLQSLIPNNQPTNTLLLDSLLQLKEENEMKNKKMKK